MSIRHVRLRIARRRAAAVSPRLLLVTGTRGSGKRTLGNLLVDERSYVHLDLDNARARHRFTAHGVDGFRRELEAGIEPGQDMVVTWSPGSAEALPYVSVLQSRGFDWVWVDGDRGSSFPATFGHLNGATPPRFVDPFEPDGSFRSVAAVVADVLAGTSVPVRTRPARAGRRVRSEVAAGAALATIACAAVGTLLVMGGSGREASVAAVGPSDARTPTLPTRGVLVSGRSLAGVKLGDSRAAVRSRWGGDFTVCTTCRPTTWLYLRSSGDPVGAGVKFRGGRVSAVFTLGMTFGWRTDGGVRVGDVLDAAALGDAVGWKTCNGYGATVASSGNAVTSILTVGPTVYGFALTRPSESVCH